MFTLLTPTALLALLGLLVPVAIHLWNRRPGREVAVGSLRWLAAGANRRLRNLKPEQLWLLLLRAALLAVLAVAVAGPVWRTAQPASRGVVLLSPEAAGLPALASLKPTIDSLRRRGYVLRWLAADFPRVPGATWWALAAGRPSTAADSAAKSQPAGMAWARVQQAAATFQGQPLFVVTSAALRNFGGSHALLMRNVTWQTLPDTTTVSWLARAELVGDSLQVLVGRSSAAQLTYRREKASAQHNEQLIRVVGLAPMRLQPSTNDSKKEVLSPVGATPKTTEEVTVEAAPLIVEIYSTPEYAADARYLEAALRAASVGLPMPPKVRRMKSLQNSLNANWTFWLSAEPLPQGWKKAVSHNAAVWQEATGPGVADTAQLATAEAQATPVTVFRRGSGSAPKTAIPMWTDGRGRPVLTRQVLGQGTIYHLNTRLNSTWSTLADDPQLPARLLDLLQPEPTSEFETPRTQFAQAEAAHDQRALDPVQLFTQQKSANNSAAASQSGAAPAAFRFTDLRPWLVLAAGLLLLLERLLARRQETQALSSVAS